ncbi:hypothetical protein CHI14_04030 [Paenibacillus sp. 7516]|nr:hypothetical protein CHI14_04030 [Paenibacillus sp. 7516]
MFQVRLAAQRNLIMRTLIQEGWYLHSIFLLSLTMNQTIPMFMEYRNICSFLWCLGDWDGDESRLTKEQLNVIDNAVKLIGRDVPFDGCDIQI